MACLSLGHHDALSPLPWPHAVHPPPQSLRAQWQAPRPTTGVHLLSRDALPGHPWPGGLHGVQAHLPSPFCRKANNFRGLSVFLLSYVATIKSAYTKIYFDDNL